MSLRKQEKQCMTFTSLRPVSKHLRHLLSTWVIGYKWGSSNSMISLTFLSIYDSFCFPIRTRYCLCNILLTCCTVTVPTKIKEGGDLLQRDTMLTDGIQLFSLQMQRRIQKPAKHLRWSSLPKLLIAASHWLLSQETHFHF